MASIEYVPGVGYVTKVSGSGLSATPSFDSPTSYVDQHGRPINPADAGQPRTVGLHSAEYQNMSNSYHDKQNAFKEDNFYDRNKDYSGMFSSLFGDQSGGYEGPNDNWFRALEQRNALRDQGQWDNVSHYENRVQYQDPENQARLLARNNAIEAMYQKGFSIGQIEDHLTGNRNISDVNPQSNQPAQSDQKVSVASLFDAYIKEREQNGGS